MPGHRRVDIGRKMPQNDRVGEHLSSRRVYVLNKNDAVQIQSIEVKWRIKPPHNNVLYEGCW